MDGVIAYLGLRGFRPGNDHEQARPAGAENARVDTASSYWMTTDTSRWVSSRWYSTAIPPTRAATSKAFWASTTRQHAASSGFVTRPLGELWNVPSEKRIR